MSRKELEAAPSLLGKLDVDEDEMISTAELMGEAGGSDLYGPAIVLGRVRQVSNSFKPLQRCR